MRYILAAILCAAPASAQIVVSSSTPFVQQLAVLKLQQQVNGFTVGRSTITGKPTFQNGICFGDGSCQATAPTASVFIGTFTYNLASYVPGNNGNTPNVCVPGSTVTYTATGSTITQLVVEGWQNSNGFPHQSVLIDGVDYTLGKQYQSQTVTTYSINYAWLVPGPAAGLHSVCWSFWYVSGNSGGLRGPADSYNNGFIVNEVH